MEHNSSGGGQSLEEKILNYMAECRNESRDQFLWIKGKLEEQSTKLEANGKAIRDLEEKCSKFKGHTLSVINKQVGQVDSSIAIPSPGDYFRRQEHENVEGNDVSYDSSSQGEITVDEGSRGEEVEGMASLRDQGGKEVGRMGLLGDQGGKEVGRMGLLGDQGGEEVEEMGSSRNEGGNLEQDDGNDDDIQILDEVIAHPSTERVERGPFRRISIRGSEQQSESSQMECGTPFRRPRELLHPNLRRKLKMSRISDQFVCVEDLLKSIDQPESSDDDLGDVNEIFEGIPNLTDPPTPIFSPVTPKRKNRSDNQRQRRIKKIAKAPIKEEPMQLQSFSFMDDDLLSFAEPEHALPSPPLSNREEDAGEGGNVDQQEPPQILPVLIKDIKVEREAHAISDEKPDSKGRHYCICGHSCKSKSGIIGHVTHKGCEEPRFLCPENGCDQKFLYAYEIRQHLKRFHRKSCLELHGCKKCSTYFSDSKDLTAHRKAGSCKKHSNRRKGQAVGLNGTPVATASPGASSSASSISHSSASEPGRPLEIITL